MRDTHLPFTRPRPPEDPLEALLTKLAKWLVQQREFPTVIGTGSRQQRRRAAGAIAKMVTRIPHRR